MGDTLEFINLDELYQGLIDPKELVKNFKTDQEFIDWLYIGERELWHDVWVVFMEADMEHYRDLVLKELSKPYKFK